MLYTLSCAPSPLDMRYFTAMFIIIIKLVIITNCFPLTNDQIIDSLLDIANFLDNLDNSENTVLSSEFSSNLSKRKVTSTYNEWVSIWNSYMNQKRSQYSRNQAKANGKNRETNVLDSLSDILPFPVQTRLQKRSSFYNPNAIATNIEKIDTILKNGLHGISNAGVYNVEQTPSDNVTPRDETGGPAVPETQAPSISNDKGERQPHQTEGTELPVDGKESEHTETAELPVDGTESEHTETAELPVDNQQQQTATAELPVDNQQQHTETASDTEDIEYLFRLKLYETHGHCRKFESFSQEPFLMVDRCPYFIDDDLMQMCHAVANTLDTNPCVIDVSDIPVQDEYGIVYKNAYCASCHGHDGIRNISSWSAEIDTDDLSRIVMNDGKESFDLMNNLNKFSNCNRTFFPKDVSKVTACNIDEYDHLLGHVRHIEPNFNAQRQTIFPISFQILMNFGINGKGHIFFSATPQSQSVDGARCQDNEVYDSSTGTCRAIICEENYKLIDSKCEPTTSDERSSNTDHEVKVLDQDEETSQITLRVNVTSADKQLFEQPDIDRTMVKELSKTLNISVDRIRNFTMEIMNGTSPGPVFDIHTFITPKPVKEEFPDLPGSAIKLNRQDAQTVSTRKGTQDRKTKLSNHSNGNPYLNENYETSANYPDPEFDVDVSGYPPVPTLTIVMTFVILPARKKTSKDVKTVDVINAMKTMINGKAFTFALNGTNFQVQEIRNNDDPLVMSAWCTRGNIDYAMGDQFSYETRVIQGREVSGVFVNATESFYQQGMYDLYVMFTSTLGNVPNMTLVSYVFVCDMPRIVDKTCGKIQISNHEYKWYDNNSVLYNGELLSINEYEYVNSSNSNLDQSNVEILLCIPSSYGSQQYSTSGTACGDKFMGVMTAESYLSFVLGIISIVAMITVLITYSVFPSLRNLPGVNTMNLTFSLCLGELLFITSGIVLQQDIEWLCKAVGVSLHYLFLASFFWMNVMSYDLFKTFANKCILTRIRDKKTHFLRYFLYAWGCPAIIVLACAFIDFSNLFKNVHIGYGGTPVDSVMDVKNEPITTPVTNTSFDQNTTVPIHVYKPIVIAKPNLGCWIMEPVAALTTFGLPMIVILISNAFMFIKTIRCIRATAKHTQLKTRRSSISHAVGKSDVVLYVRMSSVMGFTWILGLASSIISGVVDSATEAICIVLHAIAILFVVLNCSQGLFIFVAFVFNRRVFGLYRARFTRWKCERSKDSSFSSTSTLSSSLRY